MKKVRICRFETSDQGTFGVVVYGQKKALSLELPWRANQSSISCIPKGTYLCTWIPSPRLKRNTYRLSKVTGRSSILIHSANLAGDTAKGFRAQLLGCLAFGQKMGTIDGQKALLLSSPAIREFEAWANKEPLEIEIRGVVGK